MHLIKGPYFNKNKNEFPSMDEINRSRKRVGKI